MVIVNLSHNQAVFNCSYMKAHVVHDPAHYESR